MKPEDIGAAIFALGAFIQLRLDQGQRDDDLLMFIDAYFNLQAHQAGREPLDYRELRSRTVVASPDLLRARETVWPAWLPDCEKLRIHLSVERGS